MILSTVIFLVLHHFPEEVKAFHCKIVSLIQLERFSEALQVINKQPKLSRYVYISIDY